MTTVHISLGRDDGTTKTAAKGVIECAPTTRREDGTMVVLEGGFVKPLVDGECEVNRLPRPPSAHHAGRMGAARRPRTLDAAGLTPAPIVPDKPHPPDRAGT